MKYDVEIPKSSLRTFLNLLLILSGLIGLTALGYKNSAVGENGKPLLLSPRLAEITLYQRMAKRWAGELQEIQSGLEALLENQTIDLLAQDGQANRLYGQIINLQAEVDGTTVPATLEVVHVSIQEAVTQYLVSATRTINWISEPTSDNHTSALETLSDASNALDRVIQNPWMQEQP